MESETLGFKSDNQEGPKEQVKNEPKIENKQNEAKTQPSTKESLSMESVDHPPGERSSVNKESSILEGSKEENLNEEGTNIEEKSSIEILRKGFHEVTDVLAEGFDTVMNLLKPDEMLENIKENVKEKKPHEILDQTAEKIKEIKEKIGDQGEQIKQSAHETQENQEEHNHPHHHLTTESKSFRPTEESKHLVEEVIENPEILQQTDEKIPFKGRQITKEQKSSRIEAGGRDENEFWLAEEQPVRENPEEGQQPEAPLEERVPLIDKVAHRIETISQTFSQIKSIFKAEGEGHGDEAGAQSQEEDRDIQKREGLVEEHTFTERIKEGFSGVKRKLSDTFENIKHKLHHEKDHSQRKQTILEETEEKMFHASHGSFSLRDIDAPIEEQEHLESSKKSHSASKDKSKKGMKPFSAIAGKFGDLKHRLFDKKDTSKKTEEKIDYSKTPTSEMNPSQIENFKEVQSGFSQSVDHFKDEKRREELGQINLSSGNPFEKLEGQEKKKEAKFMDQKKVSTGSLEEKSSEVSEKRGKSKNKKHKHKKEKRVVGSDITNQIRENEPEPEKIEHKEEEKPKGLRKLSNESFEKFKEALGPVEEDYDNPKVA